MIETGEKEEENVRIVNVGSDGHLSIGDLNLDDLNFSYDRSAKTLWSPVYNYVWLPIKIYGTSKLCVILSSYELAKRLEHHGKSFVTTFCVRKSVFMNLFCAKVNLSRSTLFTREAYTAISHVFPKYCPCL